MSELPDVPIQHVTVALDVRPFMLSRWRPEVRDGAIETEATPAAPRVAQ